jgi:hypothetical protein
MGDWVVAHLTGHPGNTRPACDVGVAVGLLLAGLILSPPGKLSGGHVNPAISPGNVALWSFPGNWRGPLHRRSVARLRTWGSRGPWGVGPGRGGVAGRVRCTSAWTGVVNLGTIRNRGPSKRHGAKTWCRRSDDDRLDNDDDGPRSGIILRRGKQPAMAKTRTVCSLHVSWSGYRYFTAKALAGIAAWSGNEVRCLWCSSVLRESKHRRAQHIYFH